MNTVRLFLFLCTLQLCGTGAVFAQFAGGRGTESDPYSVETAEQLNEVRNHLSAHFRLIADIDLGVSPWNEGEGWEPIGEADWGVGDRVPFNGSFDGAGFTISNLTIRRLDSDYVGLFSFLGRSGQIENLNLSNVSVVGHVYASSLAGFCDGTIGNCVVDGKVEADFFGVGGMIAESTEYAVIRNCRGMTSVVGAGAGGLIYENQGLIENSHVETNVTSGGSKAAGGLVASSEGEMALVRNCSASGIVLDESYIAGGLIGYNGSSARVENCSSTSTVLGKSYVGGLVGRNSIQSSVVGSYATGTVFGEIWVGGLVGGNDADSSVSNCFSKSAVTGEERVGGLVGENGTDATINQCSATGNVSGVAFLGGGLAGTNWGSVSGSWSTGNVFCEIFAGGLLGLNAGVVFDSYCTGAANGDEDIGGLIGFNFEDDGSSAQVARSYVFSSATGRENVGGLIGNFEGGSVIQCYSMGAVKGEVSVGGLIGAREGGTVSSSFWDQETSGLDHSQGGIGASSLEMKSMSTFTDAGWNFSTDWSMVEGLTYPRLSIVLELNLSVSEGVGGSVMASDADGFLHQTPVIATAIAKDGYEFVHWTEQGRLVSTESVLELPGERTYDLVAHFKSVSGTPTNWYLGYDLIPPIGVLWDDFDTVDSDGDGATNLEEYIANTNPTDRTSRFSVFDISVGPSTTLRYGPVSEGRDYKVFVSDNLASGNWREATGVELNLGFGEGEIVDPSVMDSRRFYRVEVSLKEF